ncbi:MAG: acyl-ACP--UDP-N-acetylglucosamine O-acyltransferase [Pseudomonadota bacterium]
MDIHPSAVVDPAAQLADRVSIGPTAVIGAGVSLADGVRVGAGAVITGNTSIGAETEIFPGAVIGGPPQDLSYKGEPVSVEVGARCVLREHVTITAGTARGRGKTVVGDDCYFMVGVHVGHDCIVGNGVVLSNNVLLAGHSTFGDYVLIGGAAAIVQRVRVGAYAFISGLSGVTKDVIPFGYVIGHRGRLDSLNLVGLKRRGFKRDQIRKLLDAYEVLFHGEGTQAERVARVRKDHGADDGVDTILKFADDAPARPLLQPLPKTAPVDDPHAAAEFLETGR